MSYVNDNNFVRWNANPFGEDCFYTLPLLQGDTLQIMFNYTLDDAVVPFSTLRLGLYNETDSAFYLLDIASITQVTIVGASYVIHFSWTVPPLPPKARFRFMLYEASFSAFYYFSNSLQPVSSSNYTGLVKYRNAVDTLGYAYTSASSFYNQIRVGLWTGRPTPIENVIGYQTYLNNTIRTRTSINKKREFETRFFDEGAHVAFFAMLAQSEFYIDDVRFKKAEGDEYSITWSEFDDEQIGNGSVELMVDDYSEAINLC